MPKFFDDFFPGLFILVSIMGGLQYGMGFFLIVLAGGGLVAFFVRLVKGPVNNAEDELPEKAPRLPTIRRSEEEIAKLGKLAEQMRSIPTMTPDESLQCIRELAAALTPGEIKQFVAHMEATMTDDQKAQYTKWRLTELEAENERLRAEIWGHKKGG
jgi:hypothetical protein